MVELTEEQGQAVRRAGETATTVIDPQTQKEYVLLRAEVYARLKGALEGDDARLLAPLLADLDPEAWQDLSAYESKP